MPIILWMTKTTSDCYAQVLNALRASILVIVGNCPLNINEVYDSRGIQKKLIVSERAVCHQLLPEVPLISHKNL